MPISKKHSSVSIGSDSLTAPEIIGMTADEAFERESVFDSTKELTAENVSAISAVLSTIIKNMDYFRPAIPALPDLGRDLKLIGVDFQKTDPRTGDHGYVGLRFDRDVKGDALLSEILIDDVVSYKFDGYHIELPDRMFSIEKSSGIIVCNTVTNEEIRKKPEQTKPRPDLPRWAEANRTTKLVRVRLEPALADAMEQAAKANDQTVSDWLREAVTAKLPDSLRPKP